MLLVGAVVTLTSDGVLMSLFAFFFKPSWRAMLWIWTSEMFDMNRHKQKD